MDILNKFGSKFSRQFGTLTTDATPVRSKVNTETSRTSPTVEDVSDTVDDETPPIITEPSDSPPIPPLRRKGKKKNNCDSNQAEAEEKAQMPIPPINTQATGSVINIVNSSGIHWGPETTFNFGSQVKVDAEPVPEPDPDAAVRKTKSIVAVMESKDEVQHEHMDIVSKNLGMGWRNVARKLGYEDGMLDLLYESHHHKGVPEVIYQVLLDWKRTDHRTLGQLCTELWKDGKRAVVRDIANLSKLSPNCQPKEKKFDLE